MSIGHIVLVHESVFEYFIRLQIQYQFSLFFSPHIFETSKDWIDIWKCYRHGFLAFNNFVNYHKRLMENTEKNLKLYFVWYYIGLLNHDIGHTIRIIFYLSKLDIEIAWKNKVRSVQMCPIDEKIASNVLKIWITMFTWSRVAQWKRAGPITQRSEQPYFFRFRLKLRWNNIF